MILGRGNDLSHVGIEQVVEGLSFVPQLTLLDLRSLLTRFSKPMECFGLGVQ
jgi:hypothetical protein